MATRRTLCCIAAGILGAALTAGAVQSSLADSDVEQLINAHVQAILPADDNGGIAVAVRVDGRTSFFNYGWADRAKNQPIDTNALFNLASLAKTFDATLLALAVKQGELRLVDPVADHVTELQQGGDIRRVTLGQLASYTSGFTLPQDHAPWPEEHFTLPKFIGVLNGWKAEHEQEPGSQMIYSHAGFMLLHLALERRFARPFDRLLQDRVLNPLGLVTTAMPIPGATSRGELAPALKRRAVHGYAGNGAAAGEPGDQQGFYHWPGTGQMYSSARDMAVFLAANLGELPENQPLQEAMRLAQQGVFSLGSNMSMALAWEVLDVDGVALVEKYGGLYNASVYIGMVPLKKLGIVILSNRGDQDIGSAGRRVLLTLAGQDGTAAGAR